MTLIVGLKTENCIVIGAEQEESCGIASKRKVPKLKLARGDDWAVVFGAAGDAAAGENAMRRIERKLYGVKHLDEVLLQDTVDDVLDTVHRKYIDPEKNSEGIALVVGAVCNDQLHLISTSKRTSQFQDSMAVVGIGADIAIYFLDRLNYWDVSWEYTFTLAGFVLYEVKESSQYCSGASDFFVLQAPPNPRWRSTGSMDEISIEIENHVRNQIEFVEHITERLQKISFSPEGMSGYADEHNPTPVPHWTEPENEAQDKKEDKKAE